LGDEFAFEGFVEEGGGEFIDLGASGLITGFEAIVDFLAALWGDAVVANEFSDLISHIFLEVALIFRR
jgi:hypothetical protein